MASPGYSPLFLDIYRLDETGVLTLRPSITRRHVTAEWDVTVTTNAGGLRDRAIPVDGSGETVLALGDSFAFGWGVELSQSFLWRAEEALRGERARIVKAGIPATGTFDQLRWLERYGDRYRPTAVLVVFFVGNDFIDTGRGGATAQFDVADGLLVRRPADAERESFLSALKGKVKRSSLLAQKLAEALWALDRRRLAAEERQNPGLKGRDAWLREFATVHLKRPPASTLRAFERTRAALGGIRDWCSARRIPMLLLAVPRSFQVHAWELARWQEAFGLRPDELDLDRPQRELAAWASKRRVPLLDLLPAFREHATAQPAERLFFYPDSHLNPAGHRVVAPLLARWLSDVRPASPAPGAAR